MTEEGFREEVDRRVRDEHLSFVLAVYSTLDDYIAQARADRGIQVACGQGCSACCYQLVVMTQGEWDEVARFVDNIRPPSARRAFIRDLKKRAQEGDNTLRSIESFVRADPLQAYRIMRGKPCPALVEETGECSLYPVRPLDCRTDSALTRCTREQSHEQKFLTKPEEWANQYLMGVGHESKGALGTPAIHSWIVARL